MVKDLSEVRTAEISFVDRGANKKKFIILKRYKDEGSKDNETKGGEITVNEKDLEALETLRDLDLDELEKQYGKSGKVTTLPSNVVTLVKDVLTKLGGLVGYGKTKKSEGDEDLLKQVKDLGEKVDKILEKQGGEKGTGEGDDFVKQVKDLQDKVTKLLQKQDDGKGAGGGEGGDKGEGDKGKGEGDKGTGDGDKGKGEGDKDKGEGDKGTGAGDKGEEEKPSEEVTKRLTELVEKLQSAQTTKDIFEVMKELQKLQIKKKDEGSEEDAEIKTLLQKVADKVSLLDDKVTKMEMASAGIKGQDGSDTKAGNKSDWGGVFR
jgi:hypothetical protein